MSKEKLLASAQKSLEKGQVEKAIKDYQSLVKIDPRDIRHRQKLAELCSRARMAEEALSEYEIVGRHYAENGFYLKAIAVYKQMQKLDPERVSVYERLGELNVKQGLTGNALSEYRSLLALYEKKRMVSESLGVLQKMKELDPENLNIRVKTAETFAQNGLKEKALAEFQEVIDLLEEKNDLSRIQKLYEIFLPFYSDTPHLKIGFARSLIRNGEVDRGIHLLKELLRGFPENVEILQGLASGYREKGDFENERLTFQHLLKGRPEDLDVREGFVRACLASQADSRALEELLAHQNDFLSSGRAEVLKDFYLSLRKRLPNEKRIQQALQAIPREGDALVDFPSFSEAEESVPDDLASPTQSPSREGGDFENIEPVEGLLELEEETSDIEAVQEAIEEVPLEFLEQVGGSEISDEEEPEIELELEVEDEGVVELELTEAVELTDGEIAGSDEELVELEIVEAEIPSIPDLGKDLEEAEFYLQQGLYEEAEEVCRKILSLQPDCSEAEEKLAEAAAKRQAPPAIPAEKGYVDLVGEIEEEMTSSGDSAAQDGGDFTLEVILSERENEISIEDSESHFSLGIAYKEMGLLEDAIAEFDIAMKNPARLADALTLKGACLVENGNLGDAEEAFRAGLARKDLSQVQRTGLAFELGLLLEISGRPGEALEFFRTAAEADPSFRNVAEKIQGLESAAGGESRGKKNRISYV